MKDYEVFFYRGEGYHPRWAVLGRINHIWYFAEERGRAAAEKLAEKLNRDGPYATDLHDWRLD